MVDETRPLRSVGDLAPGDHACCFYETEEERQAVVVPFLRQGLERGHKVGYIVDADTVEAAQARLGGVGIDVEACVARGQMVIRTSDDAYIENGIFDPDVMITFLKAETAQALAGGYKALSVTGEMSWALRPLPGSERLIEYEAKLNEFYPGSKCRGLCQYDWRAFGPALVMDLLSTHPIAVVGAAAYDNYYYVSPATFLGHHVSAAQMGHWMKHLAQRKPRAEPLPRKLERRMRVQNLYALTSREVTVLGLVASGMSDTQIATTLGISTLTASKHVAHILKKLGAASRTEASMRALREGLVE